MKDLRVDRSNGFMVFILFSSFFFQLTERKTNEEAFYWAKLIICKKIFFNLCIG
jgi:hypothetical protein